MTENLRKTVLLHHETNSIEEAIRVRIVLASSLRSTQIKESKTLEWLRSEAAEAEGWLTPPQQQPVGMDSRFEPNSPNTGNHEHLRYALLTSSRRTEGRLPKTPER